MSSVVADSYSAQENYFRNKNFDNFFIRFIPLFAIFSALLASINPDWFSLILAMDLFFLGYHHVISTYIRIAFDNAALKQHSFIIFILPFLVVAAVVAIALAGGAWLIFTIYLHWQWFHYTRQSEGVNKVIALRLKSVEAGNAFYNRAVFYMTPIACFVVMSSRQPKLFLSTPVEVIPFPLLFANGLGVIAFFMFAFWFVRQVFAMKANVIAKNHLYYLLSHHLIYLVAYVLIADVTTGWLAINIWHNAQYVAFVWHFNTNQYESNKNNYGSLLSLIGRPRNALIYLGFSITITYVFYTFADSLARDWQGFVALPLVIILYQAINFHHYIVDSIIWKIRKKPVQAALKIAPV